MHCLQLCTSKLPLVTMNASSTPPPCQIPSIPLLAFARIPRMSLLLTAKLGRQRWCGGSLVFPEGAEYIDEAKHSHIEGNCKEACKHARLET